MESKNHQKLDISRPIYFYENSAHRFVGLNSTDDKLKEFFFKKYFFQGLEAFLMTAKPGHLFYKKLILQFFLRMIIYIILI